MYLRREYEKCIIINVVHFFCIYAVVINMLVVYLNEYSIGYGWRVDTIYVCSGEGVDTEYDTGRN